MHGNTGRKHSEEHIRKRTENNKGLFKPGIVSPNKGKKASPETKEKLRLSHLGQEAWNKGVHTVYNTGARNHMWKGGITHLNEKIRKSVEYKLWRVAVFDRDHYTCVWCGVNGAKSYLHADHIKPFAYFPELRFAIDNGRTLCVPCHRTTDTYGGRAKKQVDTIQSTI